MVADLRRQIDAQPAHIHRLVKMTFGRSRERVEGPTLFDGLDPEPDPQPAIAVESPVPPANPSPRRKGHGRRRKPAAGADMTDLLPDEFGEATGRTQRRTG